jgi:hypothetical protein
MEMFKLSKKIPDNGDYELIKRLYLLTVLSFSCLLTGCGHLVTGYSSIPYLEGKPLQLDGSIQTGIPKSELYTLDAKVSVKLWNDVYTSEPEAKVFNKTESGNYIMLLQITPQRSGLSFEPMAVKLTIDGKSYSVKTYDGSETDMRIDLPRGRHRKFSAWDGRIHSENITSKNVPMTLTNGCFYTLTIQFDVQKPSPDNDISVDITSALKDINGGVAERILFKKVLWKEMHQ